jgi:miniconductance mechanosensitive channel
MIMQRWMSLVVAVATLSMPGARSFAWMQRGATDDAAFAAANAQAAAPAATEQPDDPMHEATLGIVEAIEDTGFGAWLRDHQAAWNAMAIGVLFVLGFVVALGLRRALDTLVTRALEKAHRKPMADAVRKSKLFAALAAVPALLLVARVVGVLGDAGVLNPIVATNVSNLTVAFAILRGMAVASRAMAVADDLYSSRPEVNRPGALRGYRQVGMVVIALVGGISAAAIAVGKSPLVFLAALGALGAVIGVVFKDVLFSLVANLMLTANDAIRVGDWVEMKQHAIDGRVAEIKTTSVRVQNADGTVHSVPISRFVQEPWLNYRSKHGSAGRRVRRGLRVDVRTVRALEPGEIASLAAKPSLAGALDRARVAAGDAPLTNLCVFRAFVERMLAANQAIDPTLPIVVSQQEAGTNGVPIDILAFIKPDAAPDLASVEGALLDRATLAAPVFALRLYQSLSDAPPPQQSQQQQPAFLAPQDLAAAAIA